MSDLLAGLAAIDAAADGYAAAAHYYDGTASEVFANGSLAAKLARTGRRYRFNFAKTPVNVIADRLEVAAVTVPGDQAATTLLQQKVWDANQLTLETPDANRKTLRDGDGYLVVWDGDSDGTVDVCFNSAGTMRLMYDPENPRRKAYAIKSWWTGVEGKRHRRATLYYADRIERWITAVAQSTGELDTDWIEYRDNDGDAWPTPNPHGEVPVFHLRTGSPYGTPVHWDAYGPQDALTKLMVTMMATTDYAGFPLRYALTEPNALVDGTANVTPNWDDDADATEADRGQADLPIGPGSVWMASGLKNVGQLDAADPKHFLDPAEFVIRSMAQVTNTPLHFFDPGGDQPSGEARRTAEGSMTKMIRYIQQRFGAEYSAALSFALKIVGRPGAKVDVRWTPAIATDDQDSWTTAGLKLAVGVPVRQVLLEQGYLSDQVDEWISSTGEDNVRQQVLLLVELGKAVQSLGAGAALGSVSPEGVRALVDRVLSSVVPAELEAA